jgi:hypothetical protein
VSVKQSARQAQLRRHDRHAIRASLPVSLGVNKLQAYAETADPDKMSGAIGEIGRNRETHAPWETLDAEGRIPGGGDVNFRLRNPAPGFQRCGTRRGPIGFAIQCSPKHCTSWCLIP